MGFLDRAIRPLSRVTLGSLTVTGTNETLRAKAPSGISGPLLQAKFLTGRVPPAEVWVPVGISYIITTTIAAAAAVVKLTKNGTGAATGGLATLAAAANGADEVFSPFTPWTFAAADAAGDAWSVVVSTVSSSTGIVNPVYLWYAVRDVVNITEPTAGI